MAGVLEEMEVPSKTHIYPALVGAGIIALGFMPIPLTDPILPRATWLEYCISVLPFLPVLILTFASLSNRRIPAVLAIVLALLVAVAGGLLTLFLSAFSGAGTEMVTIHGSTLTIALSTSILLMSACEKMTKTVASSLFLLPVLAGLWSLAMVPVGYAKATEISAARPFCIAAHSPIERELTSLLGLRGLSFYTTSSGYKLGDSWYFHGLLLVDDSEDLEVYNWSPRSMTFRRLERPRSMIARPLTACQPRADFLAKLPII